MNICVFEDSAVRHLAPLALTRPVYDLRTGRDTQVQDLSRAFGNPTTYLHCRNYLKEWTAREYDALVNRIPAGLSVLFVNGRLSSRDAKIKDVLKPAIGSSEPRAFTSGDTLVAVWIPSFDETFDFTDALSTENFEGIVSEDVGEIEMINRVWNLLDNLSENISDSFELASKGFNVFERPGVTVHESAVMVSGENIFIEEGSEIRAGAILNASDGPIYLGRDVKVFENAVITGPAVVCQGSQIRGGAQLKNIVVGPVCKVGGEAHDSILHSYSSKVHDGFLGHSYLGRWCNLGAGTNNSNLRNDYRAVSAFNATTNLFEATGRQFLGLIMGDHSKCAIGTTFNTGTTVGVSCNLFDAGFHPRFVPSFMWGTPPESYVEYRLGKSLEVARAVMARRDHELTDMDVAVLTRVHELTRDQRLTGVRK